MASTSHGEATRRKRSLDLIEAPLPLVALEERLALSAPKRPAVRKRYHNYLEAVESSFKLDHPSSWVSKEIVPCSVQWGAHVHLEDALWPEYMIARF